MIPNRNARAGGTFCRLTAALLVVVAVAGCQPEGGRQLAGKWKLDSTQSLTERMKPGDSATGTELPSGAELPGNGVDSFESGAEVTLSFHSNGRLETLTRTGMIDSTKTGTWRLASYDAEKMTAVVECTLNQEVTETTIEWLDKDSIKMTPPNMAGLTMKLIFRRAD